MDPTGRFVYVASQDPHMEVGVLVGYTIDATSGALTLIPGSPFAAGSSPGTVAVHALGRFAYVASLDFTGVASIWVYTINADSGALTPIPGSPFAVELATLEISVDPVGKFAYTANYLDGSISGYTINAATGALTPISGSPFAIGGTRLVVDPSGKFAYHPNGDNTVSGYTINASTGALTLIPGSPFAAGSNPAGMAVSGQIH
jgi:DNA-binding beta-propeller fold protein YncE